MSDRGPQEAIAVARVAELDPASNIAWRIQPPERYDDLPQVRLRGLNAAAIHRAAPRYLDESFFRRFGVSRFGRLPLLCGNIWPAIHSTDYLYLLFIEIETEAFAPGA